MENLITILVPTYNRGNIVRQKIQTILDNKLNNQFHFLIVNDGSTDNTKELISNFQHIKNISISHNKENLGYTCNLVNSFQMIKTPYVLFMTDDEDYEFKNLSKIESILDQKKIDFLSCKWVSKSSTRNHLIDRKINLHRIWVSAKHASGLIYRVDAIKPFFQKLLTDIDKGCQVAYFFPHIFLLFHLSLSGGVLHQSRLKIGESIDTALSPTNIKDRQGNNYISFHNSIERHNSFQNFYENLYKQYKNQRVIFISELHSYTLFNNFLLGIINDYPKLKNSFLVSGVMSSLKPRRLLLAIYRFYLLKIKMFFKKF